MGWDYFSRLSRAARWYLPPSEAAEVLEDYREIVKGRSGEELRRDLGTPGAAVKQLVQPKAYRRWLAVFVFLSAPVILLTVDEVVSELSLCLYHLLGVTYFINSFAWSSFIAALSLPVGVAVSLVWFQGNGEKSRGLPKGMVPFFSVNMVGMAWVWFITWAVLELRFDVMDALFSSRIWLVHLTLIADTLIAGVTSLTGLIRARLEDRRWRAVYVWGLMGVVLNVFLWKLMTSMNPIDGVWQGSYWIRLVFITFIGLLGTGGSLC